VTHLAAITGTYDHPKWSDLAEAKAEADALQAAYGAVAVTADFPSVVTLCMDGQPPADVIHFAVHGKYAPDQPGRGLVLVDGDNVRYLNDFAVRGFDLGKRPFVFLNACQVGSGNELLGNYAGLAQSFLAAGAAAVIAPLWSVSDRVAREFALAFYEAVAAGTPAAEAFRRARLGRVADASADASALDVATPFAYQFFGHPELTLDWQAAAA
jgi:CHAT domain-containing protein